MPEARIQGLWLSDQVDECIHTVQKAGFNIVAVVSDNHSTNVYVFNILLKMHPHTIKNLIIINHRSNASD